MVILKQEGLLWNIGNVILVAAVFYFVILLLNRWVLPFNATPANGDAGTGTTRGSGTGTGTGRYTICKDAAGNNFQWYSNKPCPSIYV